MCPPLTRDFLRNWVDKYPRGVYTFTIGNKGLVVTRILQMNPGGYVHGVTARSLDSETSWTTCGLLLLAKYTKTVDDEFYAIVTCPECLDDYGEQGES